MLRITRDQLSAVSVGVPTAIEPCEAKNSSGEAKLGSLFIDTMSAIDSGQSYAGSVVKTLFNDFRIQDVDIDLDPAGLRLLGGLEKFGGPITLAVGMIAGAPDVYNLSKASTQQQFSTGVNKVARDAFVLSAATVAGAVTIEPAVTAGLAVGFAVGGPPGAIVGAVVGGVVGLVTTAALTAGAEYTYDHEFAPKVQAVAADAWNWIPAL